MWKTIWKNTFMTLFKRCKNHQRKIWPLQISNTSTNNNRAPTAKLKNKQAPGWKISHLYREMVHIQNAQLSSAGKRQPNRGKRGQRPWTEDNRGQTCGQHHMQGTRLSLTRENGPVETGERVSSCKTGQLFTVGDIKRWQRWLKYKIRNTKVQSP